MPKISHSRYNMQSIWRSTLAAFESIIAAFSNETGNVPRHSIPMFVPPTYDFYLYLFKVREEYRIKAIEEEFTQPKRQFASKHQDDENDPYLSPLQKRRTFYRALQSRNKVGWISYRQELLTDLIDITPMGSKNVQELFNRNPDLTPKELLSIMDECMKRFVSAPPPTKYKPNNYHFSRCAHDLTTFTARLRTIVGELGIASPVKVYLKDKEDELTEENLAEAQQEEPDEEPSFDPTPYQAVSALDFLPLAA